MPVAGPTAALVVARALDQRLREAWFIALGSTVPEGLYAFMACWGVSEVVARYPAALGASRAIGGVILAGVGIWLWRRAASGATAAAERNAKGRRAMALGLTMTIANPTLIVSWSAAVGALHSVGILPASTRSALPFAAGVSVGAAAWFAVLLRLLTTLRAKLRGAVFAAIMRTVGALFVAGGVFVALRSI
jgi:threonine/homoserine/homoserine lactone efflux protein